jgi:hypothetical protein
MNANAAKPKYVASYTDRHGKVRYRYRCKGLAVALPGEPGSAAFEKAYTAAVAGAVQRSQRPPIHGNPVVEARRAIVRARGRATKKGVPFSLTADDVLALFQSQRATCAVSGIPFERGREEAHPFAFSIDRISPAGGYVAGNVRLVCWIANTAMSDWGIEPLQRLAAAMCGLFPPRSQEDAR